LTTILPYRTAGRPSKTATEAYQRQLEIFCQVIIDFNETLDFPLSSRGWCYHLEGKRIINKNDFDRAQLLINDCRKNGLLPVDICADDDRRAPEGIDDPDGKDYKGHAQKWYEYLLNDLATEYQPDYFANYQHFYIELRTEKIDLINTFRPVCEKYHIPFSNAGGWSDLNSRAAMMQRFKEWEQVGRQCVLLYCGDFDPVGVQISDFIKDNLRSLSKAIYKGRRIDWSPDDLIVHRFGLDLPFIAEYDLMWIDNLKTPNGELAVLKPDGSIVAGKLTEGKNKGKDHPDFYKPHVQKWIRDIGVRKVEANAMIANIDASRELCEQAILQYVNLDGVRRYDEDQAKARQDLQAEINKLLKI
jgi:hypothetical protein